MKKKKKNNNNNEKETSQSPRKTKPRNSRYQRVAQTGGNNYSNNFNNSIFEKKRKIR